ncbi:MAG: exodeoxyribonuclease V subunit gamma [Lachnospiraceae bacterium]|nr:exodeoxyribonuclease V subunit gamma [Lachnospiraceae bacterium]
MSLQFIIGSSGSGKSHRLYADIVGHAGKHPKQTHIVLVPDQFTLQTQRKLVELAPKYGIMNIEVLSFERLAYRVFDELGTDTADVLEDTGKALLLRKVCDDLRGELTVLGSGIDKPGFIDEVKSLLSEFSQYDISPEALGDFLRVEHMGSSYYGRVSDIQKIYEAYQRQMEGSYITAEQILSLLCDVIGESSFVRDAYLVFDGYTGFTPVQNRLFAMMLPLADTLRVAVTMDAREPLYRKSDKTALFSMSRDFIGAMTRLAKQTGTETEEPLLLEETGGYRFVEEGCLSHLEANLFRGSRGQTMHEEQWRQAEDAILLFGLEDTRDELLFAASEIRRMITEDRTLHFRDFAVLSADINDYRYAIEDVFGAFGIPVFVDAKDVSLHAPFAELVSSLVHLYVHDFSYESVLRYLKCGFSNVDNDDIDLLDNYLLATGIRGFRRLSGVFDRYAAGISAEELVHLNEVRTAFMEPFEATGGLAAEATVEEYTRRLYEMIVMLSCEKRLKEQAAEWEEQGEHDEASRMLQLYPKVMDLLDKLVRLMGGVTVSADRYESILNEGLDALKIGVIPPTLDAVTFGDMERTRVGKIHTLFLIGMSDARVPKRFESGGLLLQSERERLLAEDIVLAPTDRERVFLQRFYLYLALCRPTRRLILTYPKLGSEGEAVGESYLLATVRKLFSGMEIQQITKEELRFLAVSEDTLAERLSDALREYMKGQLSPEYETAFYGMLSVLKETDQSVYQKLLSAAGFVYRGAAIPRAVMEAIYSRTLSVSASRLEKFAACAYAYFLQYTLELAERQEHTLGSVDMGNLYHEALERYAQKIADGGLDWFTVTQEESDALLSESIEETYRAMKDVRILDSARETYILERMRRTLQRTVRSLTSQVRQGKFTPKRFEVSLSEMSGHKAEYALPDGGSMKLSGIIDRLDTYETDSDVYIKIIDYKSGAKDTNLSDAYEGLQLQLILYLKAATEGAGREYPGKHVVPAAVFYYQVKNPVIEVAKQPSPEELERLIEKELRVRGLVCEEEAVIDALDRGLSEAMANHEKYASTVIPVEVKKDGSFTAASRTVSEDDFAVMGDFVEYKAASIGNAVMNGETAVSPYRKQNGTSGCDYCPYHSVCGFDTKLNGFSFRRVLEEKDVDTVLGKMREQMKAAPENEEQNGTGRQ